MSVPSVGWSQTQQPAAKVAAAFGPVLTNASQVLQISLSPTVERWPARIRGTVTYADNDRGVWFIKDATGGLSLTRESPKPPLTAGMEVEIEGEARPSVFAPTLVEKRLTLFGTQPLPPAELRSFDQLAGGREDSQWIELDAIIRSITREKGQLFVEFSIPRNLQAYIPGLTNLSESNLNHLVDARVRVRGVCGTRFSGRGSLVDYALFVPNLEAIRIVEPPPAAPFDLPRKTIAAPLGYESANRFGHRIKVVGILTTRLGPDEFFMQDETGGAYFQTVRPTDFVPGDQLEVSTFPEPAGATPSMMSSVARKIGRQPLPPPQRIDPGGRWNTGWDSTRVTLEGEVQDIFSARDESDLLLRAGEQHFRIRFFNPEHKKKFNHLSKGARLAATGICVMDLGEEKEPISLRVLVQSPEDVQILYPGPWWTTQHSLALLGVATLILVAWRTHGLWKEARLKEQYRRIVDHATDLISAHDIEGRFTTVNKAWETATGFPEAMLLGKSFEEMLTPSQGGEWRSWWRKVTSGEGAAPKEFQITGADGRFLWLEVVSLLVKETGAPAHVQSIGRDVTSRHRSEQLRKGESRTLELIADGAPLTEILEQLIGCIEQTSPGMIGSILLLEADGVTLRHGVGRQLPSTYIRGLSGLQAREGMGSCGTAVARRAQVIVSDIATDPLWADFRELALSHGLRACWSTPIISKSSRVLGTFALYYREPKSPSTEITNLIQSTCALASIAIERKLTEEALRQSEKMRAIGTLAGGIAHDFNNILGAVLGNTEILKMDLPSDSELQESLEGILQATDRGKSLVLQILAFSRGEQPERKRVSLQVVLKETLSLVRASLPSAVEIHASMQPTSLQVCVNPTQIHQVVMNLCHNACHAMQGQSGRIDLETRVEDFTTGSSQVPPQLKEGRYIRLTVSDTGHGMDVRTMERIFEPFFTTKPAGEGTGLGLAVVHGIMESYGGAITVTSSPGKGTSFHLYFPALEIEETTEEWARFFANRSNTDVYRKRPAPTE